MRVVTVERLGTTVAVELMVPALRVGEAREIATTLVAVRLLENQVSPPTTRFVVA